MAVVNVHGPLRALAGGRGEHELEGETVAELLRALERRHPDTGGWILDEPGRDPAPHQCVHQRRAGGRADAGRGGRPRRSAARDHGRLRVTELVIGTKKGLFLLEGEPGRVSPSGRGPSPESRLTTRSGTHAPAGCSQRLPRRSTARRSSTRMATLARNGPRPSGVNAAREGGDQALERIWVIVSGETDGIVYAGGDPGVLFKSDDGGASWAMNAGLWEQPSRPEWQPGGGGLCLHTICTVAGRSGPPRRRGIGRGHVADRGRRADAGGAATRDSIRATSPRRRSRTRTPGAASTTSSARGCGRNGMFMQFHGGVYRSDDAGESWTDIGGGGLPVGLRVPA